MSYPTNNSSDTATALKRLQQKVSTLADEVDDLQTEQRTLRPPLPVRVRVRRRQDLRDPGDCGAQLGA